MMQATDEHVVAGASAGGGGGDGDDADDLGTDLDDRALSSTARQLCQASGNRKRLKRHGSCYRDGPSTLGVCGANRKYVTDMKALNKAFGYGGMAERLEDFGRSDIVLTSTYSGVGTFELALHQIGQQLDQDHHGLSPLPLLPFEQITFWGTR